MTRLQRWPPNSQDDKPPSLITQDKNGKFSNKEDSNNKTSGLPRGPPHKRAPRLPTQSRPPANISQMALYAVLVAALVAETAGIFAPKKLEDIALTFSQGHCTYLFTAS